MKATVVIVTRNGGELFAQVLAAVRAQKTNWPFEILVADHNSHDGTVERVKGCDGVRLLHIPEGQFHHGSSRNLAVSEARGEFCAFLTQDALPANQLWLSRLVAAVDQAPDIAGAFGRHLAYPTHSAFVHRDIEEHFRKFHKKPYVVSRDTNRRRFKNDPQWRQLLHFYSNNNSCLRRGVWQKIPYPDVDFAEDQVWAATIIEAGWKKAYAPSAVVFHSHDLGVLDQLRRAYDESCNFRRHFGYRLGGGISQTIRSGTGLSRADWRWGRSHGLPMGQILHRIGWNFALVVGHSIGARDDWLSDRLRFALSRDKSRYRRWRDYRAGPAFDNGSEDGQHPGLHMRSFISDG